MRETLRRISTASLICAGLSAVPADGGAAAQTAKPNAGPQPAPVSSDPDAQTSNYGDWTLRCQRTSDASGARRVCEIAQNVTVKGQSAPIAQIAFGKVASSDPLQMTVVAPHDISFPSVVRVAVDEKDMQPAELTWTRCLPAGCFAAGVPAPDTLKRWRAGAGSGRIVVKSGSGQDVVIPLSFRGLAQAIDALAKER